MPEGNYEVAIETQESEGVLKIASYTKAGQHPETVTFVAHLDHPGMANDTLQESPWGLSSLPGSPMTTKFTYQLVLVQEIIGSAFYLGRLPHLREHLIESCFLEMLGSATDLALQKSYKGDTLLETLLERLLKSKTHRVDFICSAISNDEPVWESYGIPMASISAVSLSEYHSDKDNPSIIHKEALEESVQLLATLIQEIDRSTFMRKKYQGILALSNPAYNLYVDPGQPAFGTVGDDKVKRLRKLMDLLPLYPKNRFVEQIAAHVDLPLAEVLSYLRLWEQKKLVESI